MAKTNDTACDRTNHTNRKTNSTPAPRASQEPSDGLSKPMQSDNDRFKHPSLCIDTLLEMDDFDLLACCQAHPQGIIGIRRALAQQKTQGSEYLVTACCDNVGPSGDCQGHSLESGSGEQDQEDVPNPPGNEPEGEVYLAVIDGVLQWTTDEPGAENRLAMMNGETPVPEEHCR